LSEIEFAGSKILPEIQNRCLAIETTNGWELHLVFDIDSTSIALSKINEHLPDYMHIKAVHAVHPFPLNSNGKVDKKALRLIIDTQ